MPMLVPCLVPSCAYRLLVDVLFSAFTLPTRFVGMGLPLDNFLSVLVLWMTCDLAQALACPRPRYRRRGGVGAISRRQEH